MQALAGLRPGKALALEWADINLDARRILVQRQVRHGRVGPPKSAEPIELPEPAPEPVNPLRRTAANANDLTTGHRDSISHRLFEVGEPASEASEIGGTSKKELDARAARRDGASRIETEEEDRTPGSWKGGGWKGGGVL